MQPNEIIDIIFGHLPILFFSGLIEIHLKCYLLFTLPLFEFECHYLYTLERFLLRHQHSWLFGFVLSVNIFLSNSTAFYDYCRMWYYVRRISNLSIALNEVKMIENISIFFSKKDVKKKTKSDVSFVEFNWMNDKYIYGKVCFTSQGLRSILIHKIWQTINPYIEFVFGGSTQSVHILKMKISSVWSINFAEFRYRRKFSFRSFLYEFTIDDKSTNRCIQIPFHVTLAYDQNSILFWPVSRRKLRLSYRCSDISVLSSMCLWI